MAQVTLPFTYQTGQVIVAGNEMANLQAIVNQVNGNIDNTNLASTIAITDSKLNQITTAAKVSGTALTNLASIPSGAGVIPAANLIYSNVLFPIIIVSEQQAQNTPGQSTVSTSFTTMILNHTNTDTQSISSLGSNQVTLPAGSYLVDALIPIYDGVGASFQLYNVTASAVLVTGLSNYTGTSGGGAFLRGYFTLSGTSAISIQAAVENTSSVVFGNASNKQSPEQYTTITFIKFS